MFVAGKQIFGQTAKAFGRRHGMARIEPPSGERDRKWMDTRFQNTLPHAMGTGWALLPNAIHLIRPRASRQIMTLTPIVTFKFDKDVFSAARFDEESTTDGSVKGVRATRPNTIVKLDYYWSYGRKPMLRILFE